MRVSGYLFPGLLLASCASLVGVEDLHEEPRPGSGGTSGASNTGGADRTGGARATGGSSGAGATSGAPSSGGASSSGGSDARGGSTVSTGGTGGGAAATGGSALTGGKSGSGGRSPTTGGSTATGGTTNPMGGEAGVGGDGGMGGGGGGATDTTVHGTVIDFLGHPVASAAVSVGSETVLTDAQGHFALENAPATYDLYAALSPSRYGNPTSYGWVYQGLTRRDPTIQVYRGVAEQSADAHVTITNGVFTDGNVTGLAFGSPDGSSSMSAGSAETTFLGGLHWYGPSTTTGRVHALRWETDSNDIPVKYSSYAELLVAANGSGPATEVPITFPSTAPTAATISGTVTSPTQSFRRNWLYVHFSSNAAIKLAEEWNATSSFSYATPSLANSVITVAASEGDSFPSGSYAVAHKDVTPGNTGITLDIPAPPMSGAPAPGATGVSGTTQFSWASNAKVFVFHAEDQDYYRGLYVVTQKKQITLPAFPGMGFALRSNGAHVWRVEVHGSFQSVDEASGPGGFQDSFASREDEPVGSRREAGSYAVSEGRGFTTQ